MWKHELNDIEKYGMELPKCGGKIDVLYDGKEVRIKAFGYESDGDRVDYEATFVNGQKLTERTCRTTPEGLCGPEGGELAIVYLYAKAALKQLPHEIRKHIGPYWGTNEGLKDKV